MSTVAHNWYPNAFVLMCQFVKEWNIEIKNKKVENKGKNVRYVLWLDQGNQVSTRF